MNVSMNASINYKKKHAYILFYDMINIKNFDSNLLKHTQKVIQKH